MKKLILILIFITNLQCFAQRFQEIVLWQIETKAEGLVFGISKSIKDAEFIIDDFQKRNAGSKYDLSLSEPDFKYSTIAVKTRNENPVENFRTLAGKLYKVLSKEDIKSVEIAKESDISSGISYYVNTRNANWDFSSKRITDLVNNYEKYRINNSRGVIASK